MPIPQPWEMDLIVWFRSTLPNLQGVFEAITSLGGEMFFLVLLPLLYWCLDRRTGARLTILFLISAYVNGAAKLLFGTPRPFDVGSPELAQLFPEGIAAARDRYDATGNGFPSGHTQSTVVVWGFLAAQAVQLSRRLRGDPGIARKGGRTSASLWLTPAFLALAALLLILVPLSRIYLAVHFPSDVVGGYTFGILMLVLFMRLAPRGEAHLASVSLIWQLGITILVPLLAATIIPGEHTSTAAGTLLGMGTGFVLERRLVGFDTEGPLLQRSLRFLVGIVVLGSLYAGLRTAFEGLEPDLAFRFVRYAALGLWGALGAPWAFLKLRVAPRGR